MPKDIIPASMELRLTQIETALDLALKENATAMLEVISNNAQKILDAHKGCNHKVYVAVRNRCQEMVDRIAVEGSYSNESGERHPVPPKQPKGA